MTDAKLKVHEETSEPKPTTPSEEFLAGAWKTEELPYQARDGSPHKLTVGEPSILAEFQLVEALGETASNETYMRMVMPLVYLQAIDNDTITTPSSKLEVEALIQRLDRAGLQVLMGWWAKNVSMALEEATAKAKADAAKAAIKN